MIRGVVYCIVYWRLVFNLVCCSSSSSSLSGTRIPLRFSIVPSLLLFPPPPPHTHRDASCSSLVDERYPIVGIIDYSLVITITISTTHHYDYTYNYYYCHYYFSAFTAFNSLFHFHFYFYFLPYLRHPDTRQTIDVNPYLSVRESPFTSCLINISFRSIISFISFFLFAFNYFFCLRVSLGSVIVLSSFVLINNFSLGLSTGGLLFILFWFGVSV